MKKDRRNIGIAAVAACIAILFILLAVLALYPETSSRYIDEDHYTGEIVSDTTENKNHGGHDGWTDLNATKNGTSASGVSWSGDACTMTSSGKFYLSDDLTASLTIATDGVTVDLCLNGYAFSAGYASSTTAIVLGVSGGNYYSDAHTSTMNLYDCGGGESVHYYSLRDDGVSYDFSDENLTVETADGYVRGGLITGGRYSTIVHAGGVMVGNGCTLNMYGGTIAGNESSSDGGVMVYSGTFNMYGGTIAGNYASNSSSGYGGGVYVIAIGTNGRRTTANPARFTMYGGRICDNYSASSGGGVTVRTSSANPSSAEDATFTMYGGVISGNECKSNGGGVIVDGQKSSQTASFTMSGGAVRDNSAGNIGGGIYAVETYITVTVTGGEITGNRETRTYPGASSVRGGGLCINSSGTFTLSGSPYIYGNYCAGKACNLGLGSSYNITLDTLTAGARIGVTKASASSGTKITSNYESGAEAYFWSDDRSYKVEANGTSYLQLATK